MEIIETLPELEEVWCEDEPESLACFACGSPLGYEPLVRTFRLFDVVEGEGEPAGEDGEQQTAPACSRSYRALGFELRLFDRHLRCLPGTAYVTVSHVWNPEVSDLQNVGSERGGGRAGAAEAALAAEMSRVQRHIFETATHVARGLRGHMDDGGTDTAEVWHDYLSVPQWCAPAKARILSAIPRIYHGSRFTVVHMDDVTVEMIHRVDHGATVRERVTAITEVCAARWYKRVWTSMEYVRSARLKTMVGHGAACAVQPGRANVLRGLIDDAWARELAAHGHNVHALETLAGMGRNLVPWNLALEPLARARDAARVPFGIGYAVLSHRGCCSRRDFYHALLGFLKIEDQVAEGGAGGAAEVLDAGDLAALRQIAVVCLRAGDYSPLLMAPNMELRNPDVYRRRMRRFGYHDTMVYGMGYPQHPPALHAESVIRPSTSLLRLERIGTVHFIGMPPRDSSAEEFAWVVAVAAQFAGRDVGAFVATVAGRLYGGRGPELGRETLADPARRSLVAELLDAHQNLVDAASEPQPGPSGRPAVDVVAAVRMADAMGLTSAAEGSLSSLELMRTNGGTMHMFPFEALFWAQCPGCGMKSVFRGGFYFEPHQVYQAEAFRIPGLKFERTHRDGVGIMMKDGAIVGRLVWATRPCECRNLETVEVALDNLYLPVQRDAYLATLEPDESM